MKKMYLLSCFFLFIGAVNAQVVTIPDANFRNRILNSGYTDDIGYYYYIDSNYNGQIEQSEAAQVINLDISYCQISDLTGIESFINMKSLSCGGNNLTNFNYVLPNLKVLNCDNNHIVELNLSSQNLQKLNCRSNTLLTLNISNCPDLQELDCVQNFLTSIDLTAAANLKKLYISGNFFQSVNLTALPNLLDLQCDSNYLTALNLSGNRNLQTLQCTSNQFTSGLDLSNYTNLKNLYCGSAGLSSLNVTGCYNLQNLHCNNNALTALDITGCYGLSNIVCYSNHISELTLFRGLQYVTYLNCDNNSLTSLDVSALHALTTFYCGSNQLTSLNLKNGSFESNFSMGNNPNLQYICADNNQVPYLQFLANQAGYNCTVDSSCVLETVAFDNIRELYVIYPNPAEDFLNIQAGENVRIVSVDVYNSLGQLVLTIPNAKNEIDVSGLKSGSYFLKVLSDNGSSNAKFIKK